MIDQLVTMTHAQYMDALAIARSSGAASVLADLRRELEAEISANLEVQKSCHNFDDKNFYSAMSAGINSALRIMDSFRDYV